MDDRKASLDLNVVAYDERFKDNFKFINLEWLNEFFSVTEEDLKMLEHPKHILEGGGEIIFVKSGVEIAGTCALINESSDTAELVKMGVLQKYRGKGVGRFLLCSAINKAKSRGWNRLTLETAVELEVAIRLYKQAGFRQTTEEYIHPLFGRKVFKMELALF